MRNRLTLFLFMLCFYAGSAFADFEQNWTSAFVPWPNEDVDLPSGIAACTEGDAVRMGLMPVTCSTSGDVTVTFTYTSGQHALKILGADLVKKNAEGVYEVAYSSYETQSAGSAPNNIKTYTLSGVETGDYKLRYFVCHRSSGDHSLNQTNGTISVAGLDRKSFTDIEAASELSNEKCYTLHTFDAAIRVNSDGTAITAMGKGSRPDAEDTKCQFAFVSDGEDLYLWSVSQKGFLTPSNTFSKTTIEPVELVSGTLDSDSDDNSGFRLRFKKDTSKNINITGSRDGVTIGSWAYIDAGTLYHVAEAASFDASDANTILNNRVSVTYNYQVGSTQVATETFTKIPVGGSYPTPTILEAYVTYSGLPTGTVGDANEIHTITCQEDPNSNFTLSISTPFGLSTRNGGKFVKADASSKPGLTTTALNFETNWSEYEAYSWILEGTWYEGYYLKSISTNKYLAAGNGTSNGNEATLTDSKENAAKLKVTLYNSKFYFSVWDTEAFLSDYGGNNNAVIKFYNGKSTNLSDGGSQFVSYEIGTSESRLQAWKTLEAVRAGYVTGFSATTADEINALTVDDISTFVANHTRIELGANYYYIINANDNNVKGYYATASNDKWFAKQLSSVKPIDCIWKFFACENGYKIQHCNNEYYATLENASSNGGAASGFSVTYDNGHKFLFSDSENNGQFTIKNGNNSAMRTEGSGAINYWSGETNEKWYLMPAVDIEISMNAFEGKSYATAYLPFAVQSSSSNVVTSTLSIPDATTARATSQDKIPAKTGFVLKDTNAGTTAKLNILNEEITGVTSVLEGTLCSTTTIPNGGVLTFGVRDNLVGFYYYNGTELGANKAYLPVSSLPAGSETSAFRLVWDEGTTTGIENITTPTADTLPVYDLTGRRINTMQKGHIYIKGGKKFFAK